MEAKVTGKRKPKFKQTVHANHLYEEVIKSIAYIKFFAEEAIKNEDIKKQMYRFESFICESVFVRAVDQVNIYISEVLREVFNLNPKMISSEKMIKLEAIMKFKTMDEFHKDLVDGYVRDLDYKSTKDMFALLAKKHGIDPFSKDTLGLLEHLSNFNLKRNLINHNNGRVNKIFLANYTGKEGFKINQKLQFKFKQTLFILGLLGTMGMLIDQNLTSKFKIPVKIVPKKKVRQNWIDKL